jgi:hypothetical protein
LNHPGEIAICSCDPAHVDLVSLIASEPFELLLLQHPEQLGLKLQRNIAYFVEKERPFVSKFKPAEFLRSRPGKCSTLMSK